MHGSEILEHILNELLETWSFKTVILTQTTTPACACTHAILKRWHQTVIFFSEGFLFEQAGLLGGFN